MEEEEEKKSRRKLTGSDGRYVMQMKERENTEIILNTEPGGKQGRGKPRLGELIEGRST